MPTPEAKAMMDEDYALARRARPRARSLLPQPPPGSEVRTRPLEPKRLPDDYPCSATSGAAFYKHLGKGTKMRGEDICKILALTIDADLKAFEPVFHLGATEVERKNALYAMTQAEVEALIEATDFYAAVTRDAAAKGFPSQPNRVIYTGHGACFVYWIEDHDGFVDGPGRGVSRETIKLLPANIKASLASLPWWWDSKAVDFGTRIFPIHGERHRLKKAGGKEIKLVFASDEIESGWLAKLCDRYAGASAEAKRQERKEKRGKVPQGRRAAIEPPAADGEALPFDPDKPWHMEPWRPEWESFEVPLGVYGSCPRCRYTKKKTAQRKQPLLTICFRCHTSFPMEARFDLDEPLAAGLPPLPPLPRLPTPPAVPVIEIERDSRGYAVFPPLRTPITVIKTGTGSGKTEYMKGQISEWLAGDDPQAEGPYRRRVIGLAPTKNLAIQAAARWGIPYIGAEDQRSWRDGSLVTCYAAISRVLSGYDDDFLPGALVLVDELEPQVRQSNGMIKGEKSKNTYADFIYTLAYAGRVIIGDAHAGEVTDIALCHANASRASRGNAEFPARMHEVWTSPPHKYVFSYVSPLFDKNEEQVNSSYTEHLDLIREQVGSGLRVAVFSATKILAQALHECLSQTYPNLSGQCVVGGQGYEEAPDLSQEALTADWLIYTNTMSTGVSYDVNGHYHCTHILTENGDQYLTGPMIEQAAHRVRKPISSEVYISGTWSELRVGSWMASPASILQRAHEAAGKYRFLQDRLNLLPSARAEQRAARNSHLAQMQATALAADVKSGLRAELAWLFTRHEFNTFHLDPKTSRGFRTIVGKQKKQINEQIATRTEAAAPLDPVAVARVLRRGHRDQDELDSFNRSQVGFKYGEFFSEQEKGGRVAVTDSHLRKGLDRKVDVAACVLAVMRDKRAGAKQAVIADMVRNRFETNVRADRKAVQAGAVWAVLDTIIPEGSNEFLHPVGIELAREALARVRQCHRDFHVHNWSDWERSPFKAIKAILSYAGIDLLSARVTGGAKNERAHWLSAGNIMLAFSLSEAEYKRLMNIELVEPDSFF